MNMTLQEALSEGLRTTVIGVVIVFSVLIILMIVMMLMKVIFYKPEKTNEASKNNAPVNEPQKAEFKSANASIDETELVAVLTAAVAACLNTSTYNLNIKSYRRIEDHSPAWNKAGRRDVIDSRF